MRIRPDIVQGKKLRIVTEIERNGGRVSFNQLKRIVCEREAIMSERTFRIYLRQLLQEKQISRTHDKSSQKVYYSKRKETQSDFLEICESQMKDESEILRSRLEELRKCLPSVSHIEQANLLAFFLRLAVLAESNAQLTSILYKKNKYVQKINVIVKDFFEFVKGELSEPHFYDDQIKQDILGLVFYINNPTFSNNVETFDNLVKVYSTDNSK
jgi:hypothetical protein